MKPYPHPKMLAPGCFFFLIMVALPAYSQNRCNVTTNDRATYYKADFPHFGSTLELNPAIIPVGGIILSTQGRLTLKNAGYTPVRCISNSNTYYSGIGVPMAGVYPTAIPNIGMKIYSSLNATRLVPNQSGIISSAYQNTWFGEDLYKIELIKTGEITAGGVLAGVIMQFRTGEGTAGLLLGEINLPSLTIQPTIPTCTVRESNLPVPMYKHSLHNFKGVGSTSPAQSFHISLACSGGVAGTATNAHITLTDATRPDNTSSVLSLTQDSTASGIGVEILRQDGSLVSFGPDSAVAGNTNQWHAGQVAAGQAELRIPLSARYVQTGAAHSPGSANANATFTMSYQ